MAYTHLSSDDRHYIATRLKCNDTPKAIADSINRSRSTITRELARNTGKRGYRPKQAHEIAQQRHADKPKAKQLTSEIKQTIKSKLEIGWSPEQISGRLKEQGEPTVCHETIYQYVLQDKLAGGDLYSHLRRRGKKYRKSYGSITGSVKGIPDRVDIDQRPEEVNNRSRVGDWEADTIIGKGHKGAIVTLDERKSKLRLALPVANKTADAAVSSIITMLLDCKDYVHTLTFDNGKEFAKHGLIAQALECKTYFAKPYHSWERGQNENANGLLREYFPKSMELLDVSVKQVLDAVHALNSRPRKCLGYKTPYEVFKQLTEIDAESWHLRLFSG